ncbi:MAG: hypothetical protein MUE63_12460, partial [Xanthomonadales bacterium]|nr:hypothetical protein [Xanthomonadales bacterium]
QAARTRALADFKRGEVRVLVATDIAARGLDIDQLPHVVNYEMPNVPEDYVHRIGRTGRAGNEGTAVSLVAPEENGMLRDIERLIRRDIPRQVVPGYESSGRPAPASPDTRNGRSRPNGQGRQNGQARQSGQPRQGGQARQNGQARPDGGARQNGQSRRPAGNSPTRGQRGRREQPAVAARPNRGSAMKSTQATPGFSPLSERQLVDWDVN